MLRTPTRIAGRRVACVVALLYLAGVLLPSVALAFADGAVKAYCFDEIAEQAAALHVHVHVHSDGTAHHHVDENADLNTAEGEDGNTGAQGHLHAASCCGLFGFTALLPLLVNAINEPAAYQIQLPVLANWLVGCDPNQINRPPIFLLPM